MSKFKIMPRIALCLAAMLVGATLTVAVTAGAQGSSTTYYACLAKGILSHVGTTVPGCSTGAKKISWNSVGPAGKDGTNGTNGSAGKDGTNGTNGTNGTTANTCTTPPGPGLNFSACNLTAAVAHWDDVDLAGTVFISANLDGASINGANLSDANLYNATLTGAVSENANLNSANMGYTDLTGADFVDASLTNARLDVANMTSTDFSGADLTGANLVLADMDGTNFSFTNFTNANLTEATAVDSGDFLFIPASFGNATWSNTICPDGTNSNNDGDTCVNNLT